MRLIDLVEDDTPRDIPLSVKAREEFEQFRQFRQANKGMLEGREREVWAKSDKHVLRLAGTLALMEWAMYAPPNLQPDAADRFQETLKKASEPTEIDARFVTSAARLWREYFWPHARAALRQVGLSDRHKELGASSVGEGQRVARGVARGRSPCGSEPAARPPSRPRQSSTGW